MKLLQEIPIPHLAEFSPLFDGDFVLAHLVLEDKMYAEFFKDRRKHGRRIIMDNGMHENGKPLSVGELLSAAERVDPSVVIAPDRLQDAKFTWEQFDLMRKDSRRRWPLGLVIQGETREQRSNLFVNTRPYIDTLCLPYREPRTTWFSDLVEETPAHVPWPKFLHLLGVNTLEELRWFSGRTEQLGWKASNVSVDTAKAIKWAVKGKRLNELEDLRGGGLLDPHVQLTIEQRLLAYYNIGILRRYTA